MTKYHAPQLELPIPKEPTKAPLVLEGEEVKQETKKEDKTLDLFEQSLTPEIRKRKQAAIRFSKAAQRERLRKNRGY